jgi:hypothetical protein
MANELLTWRIGSRSVEFIERQGRMAAPDTLTGWCTPMEMLIGNTWQPAASGIAEEGPHPAVADTKTVILHGRPW